MDGWIECRLRSFVAKKWRNTVWRRYPLPHLVQEFRLVRLIYPVPGIKPPLTARRGPHRKAAWGKLLEPFEQAGRGRAKAPPLSILLQGPSNPSRPQRRIYLA